MAITRRQLGFGALGGAVLIALGLPWISPYKPWADEPRFLEAAIDALFPPSGTLPTAAEVGAPAAVAAYLDKLPRHIALQARGLFFAIETSTLPTHGHVFSSLDRETRQAVLEAMGTSSLLPRRLMFHALKQTCAVGYWQHDATWTHLGYDGPRVGRVEH